jgi:hypothetical protein
MAFVLFMVKNYPSQSTKLFNPSFSPLQSVDFYHEEHEELRIISPNLLTLHGLRALHGEKLSVSKHKAFQPVLEPLRINSFLP